jgi:hypothetical protein
MKKIQVTYLFYGSASFLFASKWGALWKALKGLFKASDDEIANGGSFSPAFANLIRHYPEYATVFWWIISTGIVFGLLYWVSGYLNPQLQAKAQNYVGLSCALIAIPALVYLFAVDQTLKANPLLKLARESNTSVRVEYLFCGDTYGTYDSGSDTLMICSTAHNNSSTFRSPESTIRHEVWHIIQACAQARQTRSWGGFIPIKPPKLANNELPEELKEALKGYPADSQDVEKEAFLAETFLSDYLIAEEFKNQCHVKPSFAH